MDYTPILNKARIALRIKTNAFDDEILDLIKASVSTLETRGVTVEVEDNMVEPMVLRAILTYVRMHFGQPDDYDRLKEAWETQLGQLMTTSGFTTWG